MLPLPLVGTCRVKAIDYSSLIRLALPIFRDAHGPSFQGDEIFAHGVAEQDRINSPGSVYYVERFLNWVLVAQRFSVRVWLEQPLQELMRLRASAVVEM